MVGIKKNQHDDFIKWKHFPRYWPFVRGTTDHRWIPLTKASDAELWYFLWSAFEQTVEQTIETPVIRDAIEPIKTSPWWNSIYLQPPPPHYIYLLMAMAVATQVIFPKIILHSNVLSNSHVCSICCWMNVITTCLWLGIDYIYPFLLTIIYFIILGFVVTQDIPRNSSWNEISWSLFCP